MTGTDIFMLVIMVILAVMLWIMMVWPVALIGTIMIAGCIWGVVTGALPAYMCEQMPNDPYCVEYIDEEMTGR